MLYTRESLVCVREEQVVYYSMNDEMNENAFVVIVMRFVSRGRVRCDCTLTPRSISLFRDAQAGAIYNVGTIGSIQQCQLTGNQAVRTQD